MVRREESLTRWLRREHMAKTGVPPHSRKSRKDNERLKREAIKTQILKDHTVRFWPLERILNLWWPVVLPGAILTWLAGVAWAVTWVITWRVTGIISFKNNLIGTIPELLYLYLSLVAVTLLLWVADFVCHGIPHVFIRPTPKSKTRSIQLSSSLTRELALLSTAPAALLFGLISFGVFWCRRKSRGEMLSEFRNHPNYRRRVTWCKSLVYPPRATHLLRNLGHPNKQEHTPFIVLRGFHASNWYFMDPQKMYDERMREDKEWTKTKWGSFHFLNAWAVAGLFYELGSWLARKDNPLSKKKEFFSDYFTSPSLQKDSYLDGWDLSLRYRQSASELTMDARGNPETHMPKFAALSCLANPIKDPVWVLPVESVLEEVDGVIADYENVTDDKQRADAKRNLFKTMQEQNFKKFDRVELLLKNGIKDKYIHFPTPADGSNRPLGQKLDLDIDNPWEAELSIDPNRIEVQDKPTDGNYISNTKRPLAIIYEAIRRADEHGKAFRIDLKRRDVLLVDNRRALICRKEYQPKKRGLSVRKPRLRTKRWLRLYYGFLQTSST